MILTNPGDSTCLSEPRPIPYWLETRRPFCNFIFLLPLLLLYEIGIVLAAGIPGDSVRNGADAWMRLWLQWAGVEVAWLLPMLLPATLIAWHLSTRQPWKVQWDTLGGMVAESLFFAFLLIMLGQLTDYGFRHASSIRFQIEEPDFDHGFLIRVITFMGAGIYEEFLFRLCLIPLTYAGFRALMAPKSVAIILTLLTTSFVFSLAHYLGPIGDRDFATMMADAFVRIESNRDLWFGFVFRMLAGLFFSILYFARGFGIAVGAHAAYDVFVGVVLVTPI
jgi:hypothetical protein